MKMKELFVSLLVSIIQCVVVINGAKEEFVIPPVTLPPTNHQKWAHYHWVWLHNGQSNQENVTRLVQEYKDHNIPVGAVNIDSTWATQFNNFEVDTNKFPDFPGLISSLHDQGLKAILWATSMVNVENPDFQMCVDKGYLVRDSRGIVRPLKWWHGKGGLLDYSNPEAVAWWHSKMDQVLDVGVDGFKCDGTDPYIIEYSLTGGALGYNDQVITYPDYARMYYRDFFYHTRERRSEQANGDAGLIMSRPVDCLLDQTTKVCNPFSPRDVMYSGWVGDDDATFNGMRGCLRKVIYSSWMGYGSFGCDISGYRGGDDTKDRIVFTRWAQLGSFMSLMENGGGGEHKPWNYDEEVTDIYRKFTLEHHRLSGYMHAVTADAVDSNISSLRPVDMIDINEQTSSKDGIHVVFPQPNTYSYRLGNDVLVHPVMYNGTHEDPTDATGFEPLKGEKPCKDGDAVVRMVFPVEINNSPVTWLDWWHPTDLKKAHSSGSKALKLVPLDSYAVYVREGALIPLHDFSEDTTYSVLNPEKTFFTWFRPQASQGTKVFNLRESITTGSGVTATAQFSDEQTIVATLSAHKGAFGFDFVGLAAPANVKIAAWSTSQCSQTYLMAEKKLRVACDSIEGGLQVIVEGAKLA